MEQLHLRSKEEVGRLAAELVANRLRAFPDLRLALPTGKTPAKMYQHLRKMYLSGLLPSNRATLVQLDEYLGQSTMQHDLKNYLGDIRFARSILWDEAGQNLPESLDLVVLGIGRNGHVAFCEPGHTEGNRWIEVPLAASTQKQNGTKASHARTLALPYIRSAREIILLATGREKREILERALCGPQSSECPASLLQDHPRLLVLCDEAAAGKKHSASGQAVVALGCRSSDGTYSPAASSRARAAARLASQVEADMLVLSGGVLSDRETEAARMYREINSSIPVILEEASDRSSAHLPLIAPLLGNRKIIMVSSWWHLPRLRWMYREVSGISFRPAWEAGGLRGEKRFREEIISLRRADQDRRRSLQDWQAGAWKLSYKEEELLTYQEMRAQVALLLENLGPEQFDLLVSVRTPQGAVLSGGQLLQALR